MKVWEAIQMLEAMDQTKEVTITFGKATKVMEPRYVRDYVIGKDQWVNTDWPMNTITAKSHELQGQVQ
jgi:hypothetical protein